MKITPEMIGMEEERGTGNRKHIAVLGRCLLMLSLAFAVAACGFAGTNARDSMAAGKASADVLAKWDGFALSDLDGDDVCRADGNGGIPYMGTVSIPSLKVTLPVCHDWSIPNARTAPCRYTGSVDDGNLIIAAHNYGTHFGNIKNLMPGDMVVFTDVHGVAYAYAVSYTEILDGTDVLKMQEGDWDLTLFTCTLGGASRVTVRCRFADMAI